MDGIEALKETIVKDFGCVGFCEKQENIVEEINRLTSEVKVLETRRCSLWNIEELARKYLDEEMSKRNKKIGELLSEKDSLGCQGTLLSKYHKLSWDPILQFRLSSGAPSLAVFNVETGQSVYALDRSDDTVLIFWTVKFVARFMVWERTVDLSRKHARGYLAIKFPGIIPEGVKKNILEAKSLFNRILLVTEVNEEDVKREMIKITKVRDPLIVGECKHGDLWLIDSFDETPLEQIMFFTSP